MSKHEDKQQDQKSSTKPVIEKGTRPLDDHDLAKASGGVTLNYGHIEIKYVEQK
jgi:hypothetical protein